jgi:hypothetical protein
MRDARFIIVSRSTAALTACARFQIPRRRGGHENISVWEEVIWSAEECDWRSMIVAQSDTAECTCDTMCAASCMHQWSFAGDEMARDAASSIVIQSLRSPARRRQHKGSLFPIHQLAYLCTTPPSPAAAMYPASQMLLIIQPKSREW